MSRKPCHKDISYDYLGLVLLLTELHRALCVTGNHVGCVSNLLRGRGTVWEEAIFSRFPPPPAINDDVRPLGTYETKIAARNEKRPILTDFTKKKGDCEQLTGEKTHKSLN